MSFFMPKHSSAAAARLTEEEEGVGPATTKRSPTRPPPRQGDGGGRLRRLESGSHWPQNDDEEVLSGTKSTSFSSTDDDDDESDESGDEGGQLGSIGEEDDCSLLSDDAPLSDYNYSDCDLQRLTSLVNKLHAAEEARKRSRRRGVWGAGAGNKPTNEGQRSREAGQASAVEEGEEDDLPSELPASYRSSGAPEFTPLPPASPGSVSSCSPSSSPSSSPSIDCGGGGGDKRQDKKRLLGSRGKQEHQQHGKESESRQMEKKKQQQPRSISISAVESWRGPAIEVVPTDRLPEVLPQWEKEWTRDRLEWEEETTRRKSLPSSDLRVQRSRTCNDARGLAGRAGGGLEKRNQSLPNNYRPGLSPSPSNDPSTPSTDPSSSASVPGTGGGGSGSRHYKYGKPPTLPSTKNPNPMVKKSSKKIHKRHARYALTAGMMLGIRESVGGALGVEAELEMARLDEDRPHEEEGVEAVEEEDVGSTASSAALGGEDGGGSQNAEPKPPIDDGDGINAYYTTLTTECERVTKYKFPPHQFHLGSNQSSPLPHKYKFKVYAPLVFARIRSLFGVEKQTFLHSICGKFNFYEFASNARSGQFFFYSHDGRYMIKTLTYVESKFLREILPHYYRHLTRYPSTFLTHFYGMYRVCMPNANNQRLHFIIMRSVFHTEKKIDRVYDLKGSRAGRKANVGDSVHKDLDILEEGRKMRFADPKSRAAFLEQLARDATFLARLGIMDYSLLLGMHDCEEGAAGGEASSTATQQEGPSAPPSSSAGGAGGGDPKTPRDGGRKAPASGATGEPSRSNTPFRRGIIQRASSAGDTKVGNDGFKALELDGGAADANSTGGSCAPTPPSSASNAALDSSAPASTAAASRSSAITSRLDSGIEGFGARLEDGTLAKREIYFCGIIDILQYYNARKMGETVIRKAAGNSGQDISCVDPETYGKRFVKFISNLVEE